VGRVSCQRQSNCLALLICAELFASYATLEQHSGAQGGFSRQAASQFRGFADEQVRRLQGIGTGKKGQRHELIGVHGYDIKAAMHVIRLLNEGIELMRSGTITLPRPERELLIRIRTGKYGSLDRLLGLANTLFVELKEAEAKSRLPERVDRSQVSKLVSGTYLKYWNQSSRRD